MLRFEGDQELSRPLPEAWARLTDARFLVQCIPDLGTVSRVDADEVEFTVRPRLAFVSGSLDVTARIFDKTEPTSARVVLVSKGIGSSATIETALTLGAAEGLTRVHWVAEVKELTGLLKLVPSGLIRGAAQRVIGELWNNVAARLKEEAGQNT
jgi:carbon monoxide dehydrogenase subunit G